MHIKIYNQSQIEVLKSINSILEKYKIPKKTFYKMERILKYGKKKNGDYIAFIMNPVKNDTTAILKELWLYEPEIEIADNNFHPILGEDKKYHSRKKKIIWTWFDIVLPVENKTIFVVYPMKRKGFIQKKGDDDMTERIWTRAQYDKLSELQKKYRIPEAVVEEVHRVVNILDTYYGSDRDVDRDDGGYLFLVTKNIEADKCFKELLEKYHVRAEDAELDDTLCVSDGTAWKSTLYLVSSDYGITFIYPCRKYEK